MAGHRSLKYLPKLIIKRILGKSSLFITQFQIEDELEDEKLIAKINLFSTVIVQNRYVRELLISAGADADRVITCPGGVDKNIYFPNEKRRVQSYILISGDFKARKNPEGIIRIIRELPMYHFLIHGHNLDQFRDELEGCSNVSLRKFSLEDNPLLMQRASVYLCVSKLEGGPIPILEALSSGTPVVSTPVGFVPDLSWVKELKVLPKNFQIHQVQEAIEELIKLKSLNRDLLEGKFSLEEFGSKLVRWT